MKKSNNKGKKYNHSKIFYIEKYSQYKNMVEYYGGSNQFRDLNEFVSSYNSLKNANEKRIVDKLAYSSVYATDYKTALAEYRMLKKIDPNATVRFKELKTMNTVAFATKYQNEIMHEYRSYMKQGKSAKEAGALISQYWFGSN